MIYKKIEQKVVMRSVQSQTASAKIGFRHRRWLKCCFMNYKNDRSVAITKILQLMQVYCPRKMKLLSSRHFDELDDNMSDH